MPCWRRWSACAVLTPPTPTLNAIISGCTMPKNTAPLPDWELVLSSAARLQRILPDAVLVGGTASAIHAEHRFSRDADHVLTDLRHPLQSGGRLIRTCQKEPRPKEAQRSPASAGGRSRCGKRRRRIGARSSRLNGDGYGTGGIPRQFGASSNPWRRRRERQYVR